MSNHPCARLIAVLISGLVVQQATAQTAPDAARGQQRYLEVCGRCHEPDPRTDRPRQAIGVPGGVRTATEVISPMRFLQTVLDARDIADIQAWLDSLSPLYIRDTRALSGAWYDPASSGQGFSFSVLAGDGFAFVFHGHRNDGVNLTLVGSTVHRPRYGEPFSLSALAVEGGRFGAFDPAQIRRPLWGRLELRFLDCGRAEARLEGRDGIQQLQLQALTPLEGLRCD